MLLLICGRSGAGKDTLRSKLEQQNLNAVISRTTRPQRNNNEKTHIFVDNKTADNEIKNSIAKTQIGDYRYYAMEEDLETADIYIVDPKGIDDIIEACPKLPLYIVYIKADDNARRIKAITRSDDKEAEAKIFETRNQAEDAQFSAFEKKLDTEWSKDHDENLPNNVVGLITLTNDYTEHDFDAFCKWYSSFNTAVNNISIMIQELSQDGMFEMTENNEILSEREDGTYNSMTPEMCAIWFIDHKDHLADILMAYVQRHTLQSQSSQGDTQDAN